jgi:hypothetical protein
MQLVKNKQQNDSILYVKYYHVIMVITMIVLIEHHELYQLNVMVSLVKYVLVQRHVLIFQLLNLIQVKMKNLLLNEDRIMMINTKMNENSFSFDVF